MGADGVLLSDLSNQQRADSKTVNFARRLKYLKAVVGHERSFDYFVLHISVKISANTMTSKFAYVEPRRRVSPKRRRLERRQHQSAAAALLRLSTRRLTTFRGRGTVSMPVCHICVSTPNQVPYLFALISMLQSAP